MAEFAAILRKNIEKLGETTPETRTKIYEKAREALDRKISAMDPAPPKAAVDRQFAKLDEAIDEIEAEYAEPPEAVPQDDGLEEMLDEASIAGDDEGDGEDATDAAEKTDAATIVADTNGSPTASDPDDPLRTFLEENAGTLTDPAPDVDKGDLADLTAGGRDGPAVPLGDDDRDPSTPNWRRLGAIAAVALVVIGGGYFLSTIPAVQSMLGSDDAVVAVGDDASEVAAADGSDANADSGTLQDGDVDITVEGTGSETVVVGTGQGAQPKFTQRLTEDGREIDDGPADGGATVGEGTSVSDQTPGTADGEPNVAQNADGDAQGEASSDAPLRVGQRAIFYEERTGTEAGTAVPGSVIWTQVQEAPADGLPLEPAIRGEASIPDLDLSLIMTIRRDGDATFPASHVIELFFDVPETFTGRGISDVQRVTFKGTEQDPGTALIGILAPIDTNIFLVALNDAEAAVQGNTALMRNENWIDIPLQYVSGRRALMTIEKGIPGERIFQEVIDFWAANPLPVEG
ncbi:MAG: hypothetical protein AAF940_01065 [Pseudomonadota bacterium]